jgi:hypothetical protein
MTGPEGYTVNSVFESAACGKDMKDR